MHAASILRNSFAVVTALLLAPIARADRVILISVDGLRPDALTALGEAGAPNFHRMRAAGAYTGNARTDSSITVTLPNHTGMITGRGVGGREGHRWVSNGDPFPGMTLHKNRAAYVTGMFDVAHDHGLRTGLFVSKSKFSLYDVSYDAHNGREDPVAPDHGRDKIDLFVLNEDTGALMDAFVAMMTKEPVDLAMLHLRDPDSAGHGTHWDLTSGSPYLHSIQHVDGLLERLLEAVEGSPLWKGQTWIVLTADHGGVVGTTRHDQSESAENYTIPFLVWGPGVPAGADLYKLNESTRRDPGTVQVPYGDGPQPVRNADAGNLVLGLLGLPAIPGSWINAAQDLKVR